MGVFKRCSCGATFSLLEWGALKRKAEQFWPSEDETGKYQLDMRDCPCGSTLGVEFRQLPDGEWVVNNPAREAGERE